MIVYQSNKEKFLKDVEGGCIDDLIKDSLKEKLNHNVGKSEYTSWQNSQGNAMYHVMNSASIPNDAGVAIEYNLPRSKKRIDFIITGQDQNKHDQIIIIELKQWTEIEATDKDAIVITRFQRGSEETLYCGGNNDSALQRAIFAIRRGVRASVTNSNKRCPVNIKIICHRLICWY